MLVQDEETIELRETFSTLQQEVEAKTKKLKKVRCTHTFSNSRTHTYSYHIHCSLMKERDQRHILELAIILLAGDHCANEE